MKNSTENFEVLFQQKCKEYDMVAQEYQDMKDVSQQIEKELEDEIEHLKKEKKRLIEENEKVQHQIQELKNHKKKYSNETSYLEKRMDRLEEENTKLKEEWSLKSKIHMQYEIEIERLESQQRESQAVISDLEAKIDHILEKLAIVQCQLEATKVNNEEEIQRLEDKIKESQSEVLAYQTRNAIAPGSMNDQCEEEDELFNEGNPDYYTEDFPGHDDAYRDIQQQNNMYLKRKPKTELGKRSYETIEFDYMNALRGKMKSSRGSKNNVTKKSKAKPRAQEKTSSLQSEMKMWCELPNKPEEFMDDNTLSSELQNLHSLNVMNNGFSNSLTIVKDLIGGLDKQKREGNPKPNLFADILNTKGNSIFQNNTFNFGLSQNNFGNNMFNSYY